MSIYLSVGHQPCPVSVSWCSAAASRLKMASASASGEQKKKILVARKGRLRQRYDGEYRLVAGCVPYRVGADGQPELLMVSTPNRDDLVFPKVTTATSSHAHSSQLHAISISVSTEHIVFLLWHLTGRVGGRRGRARGGVPRGAGGGRRQGRHQRNYSLHSLALTSTSLAFFVAIY